MDKILVTGNNGSVGRTLTRLFDQKNIKWVGTDGYDLTERMDTKALFVKNPNISQVVHLASVQNSDPAVFSKNTRMVENLLEFMNLKTKFIFASSNTVYGDFSTKAHKYNQDRLNKIEESANEKDITEPTSNYGSSKLACENLIKVKHLTDKIDYTILRLSAIVGPDTRFGAFKDLYEKIKKNKDEIEAYGWSPGSQKQYCHVDDIANFIFFLVRHRNNFNAATFNVTSQNTVSIEEMINMISEFIYGHDHKIKIKWNWQTNPTDNNILSISTEKLLSTTTWQPHFRTSRAAIQAAIQDKFMKEEEK